MLSQQDQEIRRNVPDPSFAGSSHLCGSGAGNETSNRAPIPNAIGPAIGHVRGCHSRSTEVTVSVVGSTARLTVEP